VGSLRSGQGPDFRVEIGLGAERETIDARSLDAGVETRSDIHDRHPFAYVELGPSWHWGALRADFGLRVDGVLVDTHYDVMDGEATPVLTPWRFQPGAFVAVAWD
jgi:hypothetical protein